MRKAHYLRKEFGYKTARELSDVLFYEYNCVIGPRTLNAYERGNKEINPTIENKLAELYRTNVEEIRQEDDVDWKKRVVI